MKLTGVLPPVKTEKVQVKKSEDTSAAKAEEVSSTGDRVVLSSGSLEAQKIREILDQTPDVRTDLVQALKTQINRGEYRIDPDQLAGKMLDSLMSEIPAN